MLNIQVVLVGRIGVMVRCWFRIRCCSHRSSAKKRGRGCIGVLC